MVPDGAGRSHSCTPFIIIISRLWTQKLPGCGLWIFSPEISFMQMMLAIHTSTRDHELWVVSAEVKMSFTSAVLSPKSHSCGGGA